MTSHLTAAFRRRFRGLPARAQYLARENYVIWRQDADHPGLEFKRVGRKHPVYSVRVGIGWRALGVRHDDVIVWFWIGSHAEYDRLARQF